MILASHWSATLILASHWLREIFGLAGLVIIKEFKQNKFPKEIYDVHMFALQPKPSS